MSLEVSTIFQYNGVKYTFDFRDAEDAALYEDAIAKMGEEEKAIKKDGKVSDMIKDQCILIKTFFDRVFGSGAGDALCTERSNVKLCYDAYYSFIEFARAQNQSVIDYKNSFGKYSNRAQRRHPSSSKDK